MMHTVLSLLLLLSPLALAQDPADDGGELSEEETAIEGEQLSEDRIFDEPDLEIVVYDAREVEEARQAVEQRLLDMGYERARRRGDRVIYTHPVNYKPKVIVDDDGYMYMRRQTPKVAAPELGGPMEDVPVLKWAPCLLIPTLCVRAGGWVISPRKYAHHKQAAVEATEDPVRRYADALAMNALYARINEELPAQLDQIWYQGVNPADQRPLTTFAERRAAILEIWMTRADNAYGDAVREAIELYMAYVINVSSHPFTEEEIRRANDERRCQRMLELPALSW